MGVPLIKVDDTGAVAGVSAGSAVGVLTSKTDDAILLRGVGATGSAGHATALVVDPITKLLTGVVASGGVGQLVTAKASAVALSSAYSAAQVGSRSVACGELSLAWPGLQPAARCQVAWPAGRRAQALPGSPA